MHFLSAMQITWHEQHVWCQPTNQGTVTLPLASLQINTGRHSLLSQHGCHARQKRSRTCSCCHLSITVIAFSASDDGGPRNLVSSHWFRPTQLLVWPTFLCKVHLCSITFIRHAPQPVWSATVWQHTKQPVEQEGGVPNSHQVLLLRLKVLSSTSTYFLGQ